MKYTLEEIIDYIKDYTGSKNVYPDTNLCEHLSLFGDNFDELLERYSKIFNVDMNDYLWYFHRAEEGFGCLPGSLFFKPPCDRVKQIPITPPMLTEFANMGKWDIP